VPEIKYVPAMSSSSGLLDVLREPSQERISLPEYLKVNVIRSANGRDFFAVLEGVEKEGNFSVRSGYLSSVRPGYRPAARVKFSLSERRVVVNGIGFSAFTHPSNPISLDDHSIHVPGSAHRGGLRYLQQAKYARTWFFVGNGKPIPGANDRYLHTGENSAGCVTVNPSDWDSLYEALILCRSGDGKIGKLTVVR
jgi:hypothetical protein